MTRMILMFKLSWKNIRLNWRHSLATMLAIMAGFTAVALFDGFLTGLKYHIDESYINRGMLGDFLVEKKGARDKLLEDPWAFALGPKEQAFVTAFLSKHASEVDVAARFLILTGIASNGSASAVFGGVGYDVVEAAKIRGPKWEWNAAAGLPLHLAPTESVMLGTGIAKRLDCKSDERNVTRKDGTYIPENRKFECSNPQIQLTVTTEKFQVNAISLKPVGTIDLQLREYNDRFLSIPLEAAQRLTDTDKISRFSVLLRKDKSQGKFLQEFNASAETEGAEVEIIPWIDHPVAAMATGSMEILRVFRGLFLGVVAAIAGLAVANSMTKSVNERIREIGMMRSMGFRQSDIVWMFSWEGFLLSLFACVGGVIQATVFGLLITMAGFTFKGGILSSAIPIRIMVSPLSWMGTLAFLSFTAFTVAYLISRRAAKMVVADALRHVAL